MRKLALITSLMLTACAVGPDYQAPSFALPESWNSAVPVAETKEAAIPLDWWKLFNDPTLTALEEEGLTANADLALAAARVSQARAELRLADAERYPDLSLEGNVDRTSRSKEAGTVGTTTTSSKPYNDFGVAAVLDYEVDLWGRLARSNEAARAALLSEQANRDAVRLAVASDIATGYFNLLALEDDIRVTKLTIASRQSTLDFQQKQYKQGQIDALTYNEAAAELATAQAALPSFEQAKLEQENALAILLGRSPKDIVEKTVARSELEKLPVPPTMPLDAPSTLLQRRPDVSAAEQQLIAANAEIGVAKADYYPTLSLSALLGLESTKLDNLLKGSARHWALGGAVAGPIVDFGRTSANVASAEAGKDAALITYQQTVRSAFADVLNALNATETSKARAAAEATQVKARSESLRVAGLRYKAGYSDHLELLDAERNFYQAQLDDVDAKRARLTATVTLYKALGGGWAQPAKE